MRIGQPAGRSRRGRAGHCQSLAKSSHGLADDLLTNTLLTAHCPVVMFPAMHTEMCRNTPPPANVATLRDRGVLVVDPDSGRLTGADSAPRATS